LNAEIWPNSIIISDWFFKPDREDKRLRIGTNVDSAASDNRGGAGFHEDTVLQPNSRKNTSNIMNRQSLRLTWTMISIMAVSDNCIDIKVMSFNMHGFHQGCPVIDDMFVQYDPDLFLLHEHWLTPANLYKFDSHFVNYFSFGCSAMSAAVEAGMLCGRPFGGVICLVKKGLCVITKTIHCTDRYVIIKIGNCILVNVYLPCVGSVDRDLICNDIFSEIDAWCQRYRDCNIVIAGDFNSDLDSTDNVDRTVSEFANRYAMIRCDKLFSKEFHPTYVNLALSQQSRIDYILASPDCHITGFSVVDSDINFSDHLPLFVVVKCFTSKHKCKDVKNKKSVPTQKYPQWYKSDHNAY